MLADTLESALESAASTVSLHWASDPTGRSGFPVPGGVTVRRQLGTDLGERLSAAFAEMLADSTDRAVVIGADCPDIGPAVIREAFTALGEHDLVLGPARDGGYYLIGLRRPAPTLFAGVSWGTDRVLQETLERAERDSLKVATLGVLGDIDTPEDLVQFVAHRSISPPGPGPRTEMVLRDMGLLPSCG